MLTMDNTAIDIDCRTSITDHHIKFEEDTCDDIRASLTCWHDRDRKAYIAQLRRIAVSEPEDLITNRANLPGFDVRIHVSQVNAFSEASFRGFIESSIAIVDDLLASEDWEDSYVIGARAIFAENPEISG